MRRFSEYCEAKLAAPDFREMFEEECHVCRYTVHIFSEMNRRDIAIETLAKEVHATPEAIEKLMNADYCDPLLTVRLCRHLGLPLPRNCSRMDTV